MFKTISNLFKGFTDSSNTSKTISPSHMLFATRKDIEEYLASMDKTSKN